MAFDESMAIDLGEPYWPCNPHHHHHHHHPHHHHHLLLQRLGISSLMLRGLCRLLLSAITRRRRRRRRSCTRMASCASIGSCCASASATRTYNKAISPRGLTVSANSVGMGKPSSTPSLKADAKPNNFSADGLYTANSSARSAGTVAAVAVSDPQTEVTDPALKKIEAGFLKFKEYYKQEKDTFAQLAQGQSPPFMIISCADSRVDPCKILGLDMGDAFVVRNVANLVPSYSSSACSSTASAIEYAVLHLKVKHLMVIGHSRCGGIKALMGMKDDGSNKFSEFIEDWIVVHKGASSKVKNLRADAPFEDQCTQCEKEAVNHSLWNCLSFPFVRDKVEKGELSLHGAYYDFVNGSFERWNLGFTKVVESQKLE